MFRLAVVKFSDHGRNKEFVKTCMGINFKAVHTVDLLRTIETGKWLWFLKLKVKHPPTL